MIDAHGGAARWEKITSIEVAFNLSGAALARKGYAGKYQPVCTVDTKGTKVVFQGLGHGDRDDRWIYTPQRVWIERQDGSVAASRVYPYNAFLNHTTNTPWYDLHLLCFAGYALHNYLTFPFHLLWPGFACREVDSHEENGETWRVLEVCFPESHPAHSRTQLFYVDDAFMLRRMDYAPLAFKVPVSQYCFDAENINGLKVPMLRRVILRRPDLPMVQGQPALGGRAVLSGRSSFLLDCCEVIIREET